MSDNRDLATTHEALQATRMPRTPSQFSPAAEIETNLMGLLRFRIDRIREDSEFEDELKQAMLERLPEATFSEMIRALEMIKQDQNQSVERILAPFIAKSERLLDYQKDREKSDEQIAGDADKDVLQGLGELSKVLNALKKAENSEGGASTAEESEPK